MALFASGQVIIASEGQACFLGYTRPVPGLLLFLLLRINKTQGEGDKAAKFHCSSGSLISETMAVKR